MHVCHNPHIFWATRLSAAVCARATCSSRSDRPVLLARLLQRNADWYSTLWPCPSLAGGVPVERLMIWVLSITVMVHGCAACIGPRGLRRLRRSGFGDDQAPGPQAQAHARPPADTCYHTRAPLATSQCLLPERRGEQKGEGSEEVGGRAHYAMSRSLACTLLVPW